mmetsp:Transcript_81757/g.196102  ORF Transcript_81757/g.196102 Transcript_81757/m.196102 type:complete len:94 (+) Transcript_81757:74-355(+)
MLFASTAEDTTRNRMLLCQWSTSGSRPRARPESAPATRLRTASISESAEIMDHRGDGREDCTSASLRSLHEEGRESRDDEPDISIPLPLTLLE